MVTETREIGKAREHVGYGACETRDHIKQLAREARKHSISLGQQNSNSIKNDISVIYKVRNMIYI